MMQKEENEGRCWYFQAEQFSAYLHTMHEMHLEDLGVAFNTSGVFFRKREKKNPLVKL